MWTQRLVLALLLALLFGFAAEGCTKKSRSSARGIAYECCDADCNYSSSVGCPVGPMAEGRR